MEKKEIKKAIASLRAEGKSKREIFDALRGQGLKDAELAYSVASHASADRREGNRGLIKILVGIMVLQAVFGFVFAFGLGAKSGLIVATLLALLGGGIPLLFAWGFHRSMVGAFNAYLLLAIVQLPRQILGTPGESALSVTVGIAAFAAMVVFVGYVRYRLFPEFLAFRPVRDVNGEYVFSN